MNRPFRYVWDMLFAQQVDTVSAQNPPLSLVLENQKHNMANTPINWAAIGVVVTIIIALFGGASALIKAVFAHLNKNTEILTELLASTKSIVAWMTEAKERFNTLTEDAHQLRVGQTEIRGEMHGELKQLSQRLSRVEDTVYKKD